MSRNREDFRELIHLLNQRYQREWERAELLQVELTRGAGGRCGGSSNCSGRLNAGCARRRSIPETRSRSVPGRRWRRFSVPFRAGSASLSPFEIVWSFFVTACGAWERPPIGVSRSSWSITAVVSLRTHYYLKRLSQRRRVRVVDCPGPFNYSRLCNQGAHCATGEHLLFLNNDVEVLAPDWLERLLRVEHRSEVGAVGATLVFPDGTLQHTGIFLHPDGRWVHIYRGRPQEYAGKLGELAHIHTVPAVTAACLLIRRELFVSLGEFDESLPVNFGDVDLCHRLWQQGLQVVVTPHARLLHFESLSRGYSLDGPRPQRLTTQDPFPRA